LIAGFLNRKQLVLALLVGLALRLFFVFHFPAVDDDSPAYEELARNLLDHHAYALSLHGHLTPVDLRAPGYPLFLAAVYAFLGRSRRAVMLAQVGVDLLSCVLIALLAASLAPRESRKRISIAALWLAATCPFLANYTAVPLTEVLVTFLTAAALAVLVRAYVREDGSTPDSGPQRNWPWLAGGVLVGLGTLVRPETPLLLMATALVLLACWHQPANWPRLLRAGGLLAAGLLLPLAPWAARNWITLHEVQFLTPRYAHMPGGYVTRGFFSWSDTWLVRYRDVDGVLFKLGHAPIQMEDIPASAFDSGGERQRVDALLQEQRKTLLVSPRADRGFGELARERAAKHPLRTYLQIPVQRAAAIWLTPRIELLPYSGDLWPPAQQWEDDPVDFSVTAVFGLIGICYIALAVAGAWLVRAQPGIALLVVFIAMRTAFFASMHFTPEPRFVLACFPAVIALAALLWAKPSRHTQAQAQETRAAATPL